MKYEELTKKVMITKELDKQFPQDELSYLNILFAGRIARGAVIDEDYMRGKLLDEILDGCMTYEQTYAIKDAYYEAVKKLEKEWN